MPTSTVKRFSQPIEREKSLHKWCLEVNPLKRFRVRISQLAWGVTVTAACGFFLLFGQTNVQAQPIQAQITVSSLEPAELRIDLKLPYSSNKLSFRNAYGDALALGDRVARVEATDEGGMGISVRKLAPGEFQASNNFTRVNYNLSLTQPARPGHMSRISWLSREQGLLMLADLLPQSSRNEKRSVRVVLDGPPGWSIAANLNHEGSRGYLTDDPDKAVFLIGPSLHQKSLAIGQAEFSLVTSGQWPFSDGEALKIARRLIEEYARVTGYEPKGGFTLMLLPFPGKAGPEQWSAETRGNNVVLLLGNNASRKRVLARLGLVLSHELFHFWVPNSLALSGDYDWFFEGFTLYQALRTDLRLGLIRFENYLETIARVNESYLASPKHDELSLIAASERRWTGSSSLIYDKGMLVAFIYDLLRRKLSNCQESSEDLYRQLFQFHPTGQPNANETIIRILSEYEGMEHFVKRYVQGVERINLESALAEYGLQVKRDTSRVRLAPGSKLSKEQKELLKCLKSRT
jgi:predicted metalloprotease with PDZ domain